MISRLSGVSLLAITAAMAAASAASAQTATVDETVEAVIITGSRIVQDGYRAPTPVTVLGIAELQARAPANLGDVLKQLPSVVGSSNPSSRGLSAGSTGIFAINLRNLGANRTLVLLDGHRTVASSLTGLVDINSLPQELVSRVDVVTGGASAAYGSDALSGVLNFVLDKTFTGLKGEVSGGVTTYGDNANWKLSLTAGTPFADGRGHILLSGELNHNYGIYGITNRPWNKQSLRILNNPNYSATNGQPQYLLAANAANNNVAPGGIIASGPLKGTYFGEGGAVHQWDYGTITGGSVSVGGSAKVNDASARESLDAEQGRQNVFGRVSFDVSDALNLYAEASYVRATTLGWNGTIYRFGNQVVPATNAFLPASVAQRVSALRLTSLTMGTYFADLGPVPFYGERQTMRFVAGAGGKFNALGTEWEYDLYHQYGRNSSETSAFSYRTDRMTLATDSVVSPTTGAIVCRSTLTNPGNGCVAYNPFGVGVNSAAAVNYVTDNRSPTFVHQDFTQNVTSVAFNGEPFRTWAGPVPIAFGGERRTESVTGYNDPASEASLYYIGNYLVTRGRYTVTEGFAEVLVPLARDLPLARSLDFNGAVRGTNYSTSGYVTTWKVGATWEPIDGIRLRATRSRDIRAPNLNEFFAAGTGGGQSVFDRQNGGLSTSIQANTSGNPILDPEKADTLGIGMVVQPNFLPGFSASIDYYNIKVKDSIGSLSAQEIIDLCFAGQAQYCAAITRNSSTGLITLVKRSPFNLANQVSRGIDFEASYVLELSKFNADWDGTLRFRGMATHYLKDFYDNGINAPYDTVGILQAWNGAGGPSKWNFQATASLAIGRFSTTVIGRGFAGGVYGIGNFPTTGCSASCPTSSTTSPTISDSRVPGAFYVDLNAQYNMGNVTGFISVNNVANRDPAILAPGASIPHLVQTNTRYYDYLGRTFRAGIRFKY